MLKTITSSTQYTIFQFGVIRLRRRINTYQFFTDASYEFEALFRKLCFTPNDKMAIHVVVLINVCVHLGDRQTR
ncbi:unnamed protein product [Heterobilharzia americana]|nr:unnamed protein product [Heterobilharzia americana]